MKLLLSKKNENCLYFLNKPKGNMHHNIFNIVLKVYIQSQY